MQNKILSILFSTRTMALLFVLFAIAMAAGTFIEDAYNTDTARIFVYNAWWFELIFLFFVINFFGNFKRYQLHKKEKWVTLLLHLSFLFIIIGAFITRYLSYEGMMPIRESESSNVFYSDKAYLTVLIDGQINNDNKRKTLQKSLLLSPVADNSFTFKNDYNGEKFEITLDDYIMNASQQFEMTSNGEKFLKLVEASKGIRNEHYIKKGEIKNIGNILVAFDKSTNGAINITEENGKLMITSPFDGNYMRMADKFQGSLTKETTTELNLRSLYNIAGAQLVFPEPLKTGKLILKSNNNYQDKKTDDAIIVSVNKGNQKITKTLISAKGKEGEPQNFKIDNLEFTMFFGSKVYELPFSLKLDDFIAEKYPGAEKSYASFKSKLEINDTEKNLTRKDSVFMNNVLDYRGFRFFQASFDPDEKGTVLSVNHDFWGTWISYIGYFLLYFGLMGILFDKNTRFADLKRKLKNIELKKTALTILLFFGITSTAQNSASQMMNMPSKEEAQKIIKLYKASPEHAKKFSQIIIQDAGGRMKPVNTFSSELLRKVSKKDSFEEMNSDQAFISMNQFPELWYHIPIIAIKKGNDSIRNMIGISEDAKYAALIDFFDNKGNYKLDKYVLEAQKQQVNNQFEKDFIDADKKINLLYTALSGQILRVFPIPNDQNNKWVTYLELNQETKTSLDTIKNVIPAYFGQLKIDAPKNNYKLTETYIDGLIKYQKKYASKILPSQQKIDVEILYNKINIFEKLFIYYLLAGIVMLLFVILKIFYSKKWITNSIKLMKLIIFILFITHIIGLIARWYVSGHAPWSDAYESMIYVAFATMFFGFGLGYKKSDLTIASSAFVTSMILMIAHWNWLDPNIANLQAVLNSYWLMIHVAVIVGSYGPFTLAMILGLIALFLMIVTNSKNKEKMQLNIKEITYINEMALTVGLVMLTIGNFLGGQWANESWGRYWGWDPKETWALISIMVYAFVIHARFVPALRGLWVYNFMSVLAYASILMTYFGVNFHLSGLHSYASGEKQNVIYYGYTLLIVLIISFFAFRKYKLYLKK